MNNIEKLENILETFKNMYEEEVDELNNKINEDVKGEEKNESKII